MANDTIRRRTFAPIVSLVLLLGIWGERLMFHAVAGDPDAYHAAIRTAAAAWPMQFAGWTGSKVEPPDAAIALLRPNFIEARAYTHAESRERAVVIIVQCRDARDMYGHYPPNCYPSAGWSLHETASVDLRYGAVRVPATLYRMTIEPLGRYQELFILNFFVRPDGTFDRGIDGTERAAFDPRAKPFGAAQVQIIFSTPVAPHRREEVAHDLLEGARPVVEAIRQGGLK